MSYSGTGQSAVKIFATYCSYCIHRNVCTYADEVRKYEEKFRGYGTATGCFTPVTISCTEKRTSVGGCNTCKHFPPNKDWPCVDCDMVIHDRWEET